MVYRQHRDLWLDTKRNLAPGLVTPGKVEDESIHEGESPWLVVGRPSLEFGLRPVQFDENSMPQSSDDDPAFRLTA